MTAANILIDGSNSLFWRGGQAQASLPEMLVHALRARRFAPHLYFDHSIGRHMQQSQLDDLAQLATVIIARRGSQADGLMLDACAGGRIQIVSNDKFRNWRDAYPNLRKDWLVSGRIGKGGRVGFSKSCASPRYRG